MRPRTTLLVRLYRPISDRLRPQLIACVLAMAAAMAANLIGPGRIPLAQASGSAYSQAVSADSPVSYWRLDESSGSTAADSSGNANSATYYGGVSLSSSSALPADNDSAVTMDGSTGYVEAPNSASLNQPTSAITIESWVKPTSGGFSSQKPIVLKSYTSHVSPYYQYGTFLVDSGSYPKDFAVGMAIGGAYVGIDCTNSGWSYGVWNHVVAVYDGKQILAYINGQLKCISPQSGTLSTYATTLDIGAYANLAKSSSYLFNGGIDEVAVYPSALSAARIAAHYNAAGYTPSAPAAVSAAAGSNQATVSWTAPSTPGASSITGYTVTPKVGGYLRTPVSVTGTGTSATLTGLSGADSYISPFERTTAMAPAPTQLLLRR